MSFRAYLTKSAAPAKRPATSKAPRPKLSAGADAGRAHPMLSDQSPLTRAICKAAGLPDVGALLVALAHPMSDEDEQALAKKAGGHPAHAQRICHLRQLAIQKHGELGHDPRRDED